MLDTAALAAGIALLRTPLGPAGAARDDRSPRPATAWRRLPGRRRDALDAPPAAGRPARAAAHLPGTPRARTSALGLRARRGPDRRRAPPGQALRAAAAGARPGCSASASTSTLSRGALGAALARACAVLVALVAGRASGCGARGHASSARRRGWLVAALCPAGACKAVEGVDSARAPACWRVPRRAGAVAAAAPRAARARASGLQLPVGGRRRARRRWPRCSRGRRVLAAYDGRPGPASSTARGPAGRPSQSNRYALLERGGRTCRRPPAGRRRLGSFAGRVARAARPVAEGARDAHSLYLETAAELGLVGLALRWPCSSRGVVARSA